MGFLGSVTVGRHLIQIQTEVVEALPPLCRSVAILNGRILRTLEEPLPTEQQDQEQIQQLHLQFIEEVRHTVLKRLLTKQQTSRPAPKTPPAHNESPPPSSKETSKKASQRASPSTQKHPPDQPSSPTTPPPLAPTEATPSASAASTGDLDAEDRPGSTAEKTQNTPEKTKPTTEKTQNTPEKTQNTPEKTTAEEPRPTAKETPLRAKREGSLGQPTAEEPRPTAKENPPLHQPPSSSSHPPSLPLSSPQQPPPTNLLESLQDLPAYRASAFVSGFGEILALHSLEPSLEFQHILRGLSLLYHSFEEDDKLSVLGRLRFLVLEDKEHLWVISFLQAAPPYLVVVLLTQEGNPGLVKFRINSLHERFLQWLETLFSRKA